MTVMVNPPHGTRARYQHRTFHCRCTECRAANARYMADYRRGIRTPEIPLTTIREWIDEHRKSKA